MNKRACLTAIVLFGTFGYFMVVLIFWTSARIAFDPLLLGYVDERPLSTYIREPRKFTEQICDKTPCIQEKDISWSMVVFVKSKIDFYKRREFLRRTWGAVNYLNGTKFELVFLMGKTNNKHAKALLDEEEARYGDLLQYDGPDDYVNMPFKVLAGMEWAGKYLSEDAFYASADDDFLIDLNQFVEKMNVVIKNFQGTNRTDFPIVCLFIRGEEELAVRTRSSKWFVSHNEYKKTFYPPYCHGGMYVMSLPVAMKLWNTSRTAPMLRLDDVWITGILRRRMNFSDNLVYSFQNVTTHFGTVSDTVRRKMDEKWLDIEAAAENSNSNICKCML